MNGNGWAINTGWSGNDMTSCCNGWFGVTCNNGAVTKIELPYNNLVGTLPDVFGSIGTLMILDLSHNQISGSIPGSLSANMANLRFLNLDVNAMNGNLPGFQNMPMLSSIHLKNNTFTGSIPDSWGSILTLTDIYLSNNNLTGPFPGAVLSLNQLVNLALDNNQINGVIPNNLGSMTSLQTFNLKDNHILGPIPESVGNLTGLTSFDLSNNRLRGNISPNIGRLQKLKRIMLGHNGLNGNIPEEFGTLGALEYIQLNFNQLNGQFPGFMAPRALGYCYMTPNQFQLCPDQTIVGNPNSMAFQCATDCIVGSTRPGAGSSTRVNLMTLITLAMAALAFVLI
ncbi:hypothetical protein BDC45DRAFT_593913 [Circinella umbellata]|nr:hypothetical protein BDC45DRAFT_593913 [Circinella umbellata]